MAPKNQFEFESNWYRVGSSFSDMWSIAHASYNMNFLYDTVHLDLMILPNPLLVNLLHLGTPKHILYSCYQNVILLFGPVELSILFSICRKRKLSTSTVAHELVYLEYFSSAHSNTQVRSYGIFFHLQNIQRVFLASMI